jgi:hypothetical protein
MSTLDTWPFRQRMPRYLNRYGLIDEAKGEDGFDPTIHAPLGAPAQKVLQRITRHAETRKNEHGRKLYPDVEETGVLTAPVRAMFYAEFPQRPTFEDAFKRIAIQDDKFDAQEQYTQGPHRWQGVDAVFGKTVFWPAGKQIPKLTIGDCSSGYTRWVLWALQQHTGRVPHDVVNGCGWNAGYTGTITGICKKVATPKIGDAILYFNSRGSSVHVTGVFDIAKRTCISHGRDKAEIYGWDAHAGRGGFYRPDFARA